MPVTIANTYVNTHSMDYLINRVNDLAYTMSTVAVTTSQSTLPTASPGNAAITGVLTCGNSTANAIITSNTITLSNTTSNTVISIPTVAQGTNNQFYLNANNSWSIPSLTYAANGLVTTTGTSAQLIDSFANSLFNSADYLMNVLDTTNSNNAYTTKLLVLNTSVNTFITDYGGLLSGANCGVFSANANSTHVRVYFTPALNNTNVSFVRTNA